MTSKAVSALRNTWRLTYAVVDELIPGPIPADYYPIDLYGPQRHHNWRERVAFAGFAVGTIDGETQRIYFDGYKLEELASQLMLPVATPKVGDRIVGLAYYGHEEDGYYFLPWGVLTPEFRTFIDLLWDDELGTVEGDDPQLQRLVPNPHLWVLAQLVFRDDIALLADAFIGYLEGKNAMEGISYFLHYLAHSLDMPRWWQDFEEAVRPHLEGRGVTHPHIDSDQIRCKICGKGHLNFRDDTSNWREPT